MSGDKQMVRFDTAGEAIYPGKEAWKNEPGNRYTADELREMARNWDITLKKPRAVQTRRAE
jgi:transposase